MKSIQKLVLVVICLSSLMYSTAINALSIYGCMDKSAINYNKAATRDDFSCKYEEVVYGCTDLNAYNYNINATLDDGTCKYYVYGCTDYEASNYNSLANQDDGSCKYTKIIYGCMDYKAQNYNPLANIDDASCIFSKTYGCMDPLATNYNINALKDDGSCRYAVKSGCNDPSALNYNPKSKNNDGSCIYTEVSGCTDVRALNYNPKATNNDNSCQYLKQKEDKYGCTDSRAANFDITATINDNSCKYSDTVQTLTNKTEISTNPIVKLIPLSLESKQKVENIEIEVYNGSNQLIKKLNTDVYGKANFILDQETDLKFNFFHPYFYIESYEGNYIPYNDLTPNKKILLSVFANKDVNIDVYIEDFYTKEFVNDAKLLNDIIDFTYENKNGFYRISILKEELRNKNIKFGDELDFTIYTNEANPIEKFKVFINPQEILKYDARVSRQISKKIQFIDSYSLKPLKNIKVMIDDNNVVNKDSKFFLKTNNSGNIEYKFFGQDFGKYISLNVDIPQYVESSKIYTLDANQEILIVKVNPIYSILKVLDSKTNKLVDGLKIYYKNDVISEVESPGMYKVNLSSMNKKYNLRVVDSNKNYENKELSYIIDNNNINETENLFVNQRTFLDFNISDLTNDKVGKVDIYMNGNKIGNTNNKGMFNYEIKYVQEPIDIVCSKNGYIKESFTIDLEPGLNKSSLVLKTISCKIKLQDYSTKKSINTLFLENENIIKYYYDNKIQAYIVQFSDFGDYNINIYDEENIYQNSAIEVNMTRDSIMKQYTNDMYEVTFVKIQVTDDDGRPVKDAVIKLNKKEIGDTNRSGKLRKRITYSKPSINFSCIASGYYSYEKNHKIKPGKDNELIVQIKRLPEVVLQVLDKEKKDIVNDIIVFVNDKEYEVDDYGKIKLQPKKINQKFEIVFSDGEIDYFNQNLDFNYSDTVLKYDLFLSPIPYIYLEVLDSRESYSIKDAKVFINDQDKGRTTSDGRIKVKVKNNSKNKLIIRKKGFDVYEKSISINNSKTDVEVQLDKLEQKIIIRDMFGKVLENVKLIYNDKIAFTDKDGLAILNPEYLNKDIEIKFESNKNYHKKINKIYSFSKNYENHSVSLETRPLKLFIKLVNKMNQSDISDKVDGVISINPSPNNNSTFELFNNQLTIDVFESNNYQINGDFVLNDQSIKYSKSIYIDLNNAEKKHNIFIYNPDIEIIDNEQIEDIEIVSLENDVTKQYNGSKIQLDSYGDYKITYNIVGNLNSYSQQKNISINEQNNRIDLSLSNYYLDCLEQKNIGENGSDIWEKKCSQFIENEIDKDVDKDVKYCEVLEWLALSNFEVGDYIESKNYFNLIINSVNECGTNPSYYKMYNASLSKITPSDIAYFDRNELEADLDDWLKINDFWKDDGYIEESFNSYSVTCNIIGKNCDNDLVDMKINLLTQIATLMDFSNIAYTYTFFDEDDKSFVCSVNNNLFNQINKYSKDIPSYKITGILSNIEKYKLNDCD